MRTAKSTIDPRIPKGLILISNINGKISIKGIPRIELVDTLGFYTMIEENHPLV